VIELPQVIEKGDRDSIPRMLPVDSDGFGLSARCKWVDGVRAVEDLTTGDADLTTVDEGPGN